MAVERLNDQAALAELARDATNWPGAWGVREYAMSKLTNQEALASGLRGARAADLPDGGQRSDESGTFGQSSSSRRRFLRSAKHF